MNEAAEALSPEPAPEPPWRFENQSLTILRELTFDEWAQMWSTADAVQRNFLWYVGDALAYGEARFGEKYASVIDDYAPETRGSAKWVASRIPPLRRRPELTFSHHRAVAALTDPELQDQLLQRAIDEGLKSKELEEIAKPLKPNYKPRVRRQDLPYPSNSPPVFVMSDGDAVGGPIIDVYPNGEDSARNPFDGQQQRPEADDPRLPEWLEKRAGVVELRKASIINGNGPTVPAPQPAQPPPTPVERLRDLIEQVRQAAAFTLGVQEPWTLKVSAIPTPPGQPKEWVLELRRATDRLSVGLGQCFGCALAEAALAAAIVDLGEEV